MFVHFVYRSFPPATGDAPILGFCDCPLTLEEVLDPAGRRAVEAEVSGVYV